MEEVNRSREEEEKKEEEFPIARVDCVCANDDDDFPRRRKERERVLPRRKEETFSRSFVSRKTNESGLFRRATGTRARTYSLLFKERKTERKKDFARL